MYSPAFTINVKLAFLKLKSSRLSHNFTWKYTQLSGVRTTLAVYMANYCTVDLHVTYTIVPQIHVALQWRLLTYKITFSKNRGWRKNWLGSDETDPTGSAGLRLGYYQILHRSSISAQTPPTRYLFLSLSPPNANSDRKRASGAILWLLQWVDIAGIRTFWTHYSNFTARARPLTIWMGLYSIRVKCESCATTQVR